MDSDFVQGVRNFFSSDEQKKDLVDPYVVFSFAGKKVKILFKLKFKQKFGRLNAFKKTDAIKNNTYQRESRMETRIKNRRQSKSKIFPYNFKLK